MSWNKAARKTYKRNAERIETDLMDEEWALIEPVLPPPSRMGRQRKTDQHDNRDESHGFEGGPGGRFVLMY